MSRPLFAPLSIIITLDDAHRYDHVQDDGGDDDDDSGDDDDYDYDDDDCMCTAVILQIQ